MTHASVTQTHAWQKLTDLASLPQKTLNELFQQDTHRAQSLTLKLDDLLLDYSKNRVDTDILNTLFSLAEETQLNQQIKQLITGEKINNSEDRAVLHTALRADCSQTFVHEGENIHQAIDQQKQKIRTVSHKIREGLWLGSTGKKISDVINIGIGGSDLGPKMVCNAMAEFAHPDLTLHFISNVDGAEIIQTLKTLNAETTLIIVASKTFTTQETMLNVKTVLEWFEAQIGLKNAQTSSHFIGLSSQPQNAMDFGIPEDNILSFWDWVGGRYSVWSSIGLSVAICIGYENFDQFLLGARSMDEHFTSAPLEQNMPVIIGLLGIWYSNFLKAQSYAVIPYCERLSAFPSYLQQMDMESNGKRATRQGKTVDYDTGPIVWGQTGTNGQHAFFQLLHQGTRLVPIDFIAAVNDDLSNTEHHNVLLGNMLAQGAALMAGKQDNNGAHKQYPGNKPSNTLLVNALTPKTLGMLIALYEHKVFVQGAIWGINSFDQWGVELGKAMAKALLSDDKGTMDASTEALSAFIKA